MKRFIVLILMMMPFVVMAQDGAFAKVTNKYADNDAVTVMSFTKAQLMAFVDEDAAKDLDNIDSIEMVLVADKGVYEDVYKDASKVIKRIKAEELLSTADEEFAIKIYTTTDGDVVTSIIILLSSDEQSGLVVLNGRMSADELGDIVQVESDKLKL